MEQEKENIGAPQAAAHGAEARTEGGAAAPADLGKFKSVDALLNAYNSLEAEFTRRSQRLTHSRPRRPCTRGRSRDRKKGRTGFRTSCAKG